MAREHRQIIAKTPVSKPTVGHPRTYESCKTMGHCGLGFRVQLAAAAPDERVWGGGGSKSFFFMANVNLPRKHTAMETKFVLRLAGIAAAGLFALVYFRSNGPFLPPTDPNKREDGKPAGPSWLVMCLHCNSELSSQRDGNRKPSSFTWEMSFPSLYHWGTIDTQLGGPVDATVILNVTLQNDSKSVQVCCTAFVEALLAQKGGC